MNDVFVSFLLPQPRLVMHVAITTNVLLTAQRLHALSLTQTIALGRMFSSAALLELSQHRHGSMSLHYVSSGRIRQIFVDVTPTGELRGYLQGNAMTLESMNPQANVQRISIAAESGQGMIQVLASHADAPGGFVQSSVSLVSGEIDTDLEHWLKHSEQVESILMADVLLNAEGYVVVSGGICLQALPQADLEQLEQLRTILSEGGFTSMLEQAQSAEQLGKAIAPDAQQINAAVPLRFQCRCSRERVLNSLKLLGPEDLADMIEKQEAPSVRCEFCTELYHVTCEEVAQAYAQLVPRAFN